MKTTRKIQTVETYDILGHPRSVSGSSGHTSFISHLCMWWQISEKQQQKNATEVLYVNHITCTYVITQYVPNEPVHPTCNMYMYHRGIGQQYILKLVLNVSSHVTSWVSSFLSIYVHCQIPHILLSVQFRYFILHLSHVLNFSNHVTRYIVSSSTMVATHLVQSLLWGCVVVHVVSLQYHMIQLAQYGTSCTVLNFSNHVTWLVSSTHQ